MSLLTRRAQWFLLMVSAPWLLACGAEHRAASDEEPAGMARIEGSVVYRERMLLPPGFEVEVQLEDVSRADAMATVMTSVLLTPQGAPPYQFVIEYDPALIDKRMRYALRARISHGERLMFTSTDYIDPFEGNPVEILVRRVPGTLQHQDISLEGGVWVLQSLAGEPISPGAGGKSVDLQFSAAEMRAAGFSGCNRYTGGYVREGDPGQGSPLRFGPMAGTMMACADGAELERSFLQMLGTVTAFRLDGDTLSLLAGGDVVATFTSS